MKEFVEKLKEYLEGNKYKFVNYRTGFGGCETCGWGAEQIEELDGDALWAEIDEFCESFNK